MLRCNGEAGNEATVEKRKLLILERRNGAALQERMLLRGASAASTAFLASTKNSDSLRGRVALDQRERRVMVELLALAADRAVQPDRACALRVVGDDKVNTLRFLLVARGSFSEVLLPFRCGRAYPRWNSALRAVLAERRVPVALREDDASRWLEVELCRGRALEVLSEKPAVIRPYGEPIVGEARAA